MSIVIRKLSFCTLMHETPTYVMQYTEGVTQGVHTRTDKQRVVCFCLMTIHKSTNVQHTYPA